MMIDIEDLKRKARAATPGKWTWKQVGTFKTPGCALFWPDSSKGGVHYRRMDSNGGMLEADADYIASAQPVAILALIERLEAAERGAARYRKVKQLAAIGLSRNGPSWVVRADLPPSDATTITQEHFEQAIDAAISKGKA